MRNFILAHTSKDGICKYPGAAKFFIQVSPSSYDKRIFVIPLYPTDSLNELRFIGCDQQGLSVLPFQEIVNVFDKFVWIGIAMTITSASITIKFLSTQSNLLSNMFPGLKLILEQSSPFSRNVVNKMRLRCLVTLLLICIHFI